MNIILFRNIIAKFWVEEMNNEVVVMFVRAGMVLANIRIRKDYILARDSGLVPIGAVIYGTSSGKPIPEFYKNIKSIDPELFATNASMINTAVISSEPKTQEK